jgi:hypothetical protein
MPDMPAPPDRSALQHMLFEDPLLLIIVLVAGGLVLGWHALREGLPRRAGAAAMLVVAAGVLYLAADRVTTPAEHGAAVVRDFVAAVGRGDAVAVDQLLAADATVHSGREENPGQSRALVVGGVSILRGRGVESVSIGSLEAWPDGRGGAVMHLSASARSRDWGPTGSRWVIRAEPAGEAGDGPDDWRITRLTWIDLMGQSPPGIPGGF